VIVGQRVERRYDLSFVVESMLRTVVTITAFLRRVYWPLNSRLRWSFTLQSWSQFPSFTLVLINIAPPWPPSICISFHRFWTGTSSSWLFLLFFSRWPCPEVSYSFGLHQTGPSSSRERPFSSDGLLYRILFKLPFMFQEFSYGPSAPGSGRVRPPPFSGRSFERRAPRVRTNVPFPLSSALSWVSAFNPGQEWVVLHPFLLHWE